MKQLIQDFKTGNILIEEVPVPALKTDGVLVQNVYSLISAGTERTTVDTGKSSLIGKAKKRPDLVKQILDNVKSEGLLNTYKKVKTRLSELKPLGYSSAGVVIEGNCEEFKKGDRVACGGGGYATHSEIIFVPKNLAVRIPETVSFEEAAFSTLGAIAMQGVRQANVNVGENVVVIGLGLVGLLSVQILKVSGCNVFGMDIDKEKLKIAKKLGCSQVAISSSKVFKTVESFTKGIGVDSAIITASTRSNEPMELAIEVTRDRGKIIVLGNVKMDISWSKAYEKEIDVRMSRSYGPGRYDSSYEEKGIDYPVGYVRWTEKRNMESFLELVSNGKIQLKSLITHKFDIEDSVKAYDLILGKAKEPYIGILIRYPTGKVSQRAKFYIDENNNKIKKIEGNVISLGFIGCGHFAQAHLLPYLRNRKDINLKGVCTTTGVSAMSAGKKFGFEYYTTSADDILGDKDIDAVFIATRHNSHSYYVQKVLGAEKHCYVEKPLAINEKELNAIKDIYNKHSEFVLQVGFNRRYSKSALKIKEFFQGVSEPFIINYRVNAGFIPKDSWYQQPDQGGRIIGEGCHFFDFMQFITDSWPANLYAESITSQNKAMTENDDVIITVKFRDGSVGVLTYVASGDNALQKELCEIYSSGKVAVLNDYKKVYFYKNGKKKAINAQGKGYKEELENFLRAIKGNVILPLRFESVYYTTITTIKSLESLRIRKPVEVYVD